MPTNQCSDSQRTWRLVAFASSAAAAGIHFGAVHEHAREYAPTATFMLVSGVAQLVWAIWIARGAPRWVAAAGVGGNWAIATLWVLTRTTGLPFGPNAWMPEHIHGPDVLATVLEVIVVIAAWALVAGASSPPAPFLIRLACAGALAATIVAGTDAAHETGAAAATLVIALVVRSFPLQSFFEDRRSHVKVSFGGGNAGRLRTDAGAGIGASGSA